MLKPILEHIDVIEDDLEVRTLLKTILQSQGYSVQTYESVESFWQASQSATRASS